MRQKSVESGTSDQMSPMSGPESPPCWVNAVSAFNRSDQWLLGIFGNVNADFK